MNRTDSAPVYLACAIILSNLSFPPLPLPMIVTSLTFAITLAAPCFAAQLRPGLTVPTLTQVRGILALLEAPIISTLVSRAALPAEASLYSNGGQDLLAYIAKKEKVASSAGRFDYGTLEYPFTLPLVRPDRTTNKNTFPPGRFHQDTFSPNSNLTTFYINTLVPLIQAANVAAGSSSVFFHMASPTPADVDAKYNLDATLLALLSHRASIGKIVAESKFASNTTGFIPLIESKDVSTIRILLTNTTQESVVLATADAAAQEVANAWGEAQTFPVEVQMAFTSSVQEAVAKLFRELIDVTTLVEVKYLLQRLN
ncbi:chorismate mutase [Pluteus cervinus]|uniref:Chorismate mutase n=1 Tax=Pluteus cervinus TaxID=181527 RepID=A0ACD3AVR8_9AGAR|nr:chorismate mutase [Pluteus cervinus]